MGLPHGRLSTAGGVLTLLALYFALQWLVRILIGGGLELDEAEQVIFGQRLQAGYSPDPPLYTWLQIPLFRLLGDGVPALSLLKNLLLFTTYTSSYFIARQCGLSPQRSGLAALALILLPQIGWESQRDLTHSVLVTTVASLTLWSLLALLNGAQGVGQYLLLGILAGLGMLSKFNYGLFLLVSLIALGSLRPSLLFRPAALVSLLAGSAMVAPFFWWALNNMEMATATSYKLKAGEVDYWSGLAQGLISLASAYLAFSGLFLLAFVAVFRPWQRSGVAATEANEPVGVRFLKRLFVITPVVMIAYLLFSGGAVYRDRWLLPLLFFLPILCFAMLPEDLTGGVRSVRFRRLLLGVMLLVPMGLLARGFIYPLAGEVTKPHFPGAALARALEREAGYFHTVVAESTFIGGNLKPHLGNRFVDSPTVDFPVRELIGDAEESVLLIWNGGDYPDAPPADLTGHLRQADLDLSPVGAPRTLQRRYRFSRDQSFTLAWQYWR